MSRCFPYPLPYFGQAENQSIKLLKEERAKKHKDKAKKKDKAVSSNHEEKQHKKRKHKDKSEDDKRSHKKRKSENEQLPLVRDLCSQKTSEAIEHLEKSGLTEELELPCSIRHKLDSPESSQDSSKRRKLVPSSSCHDPQGTTLCIKLPILRQRVAEPSSLPLSRQTELQPPLPLSGRVKLALPSSRQIKPRPLSSPSSSSSSSSGQIKLQPSLQQSGLGGLTVPSQKLISVPSSDQAQPAVPSSRQTRELPPLPSLGRLKRVVPSSKQTKLQLSSPPSGQVAPSLPLTKHTDLQEQPPLPSLSTQICPQPKNVQKLDQMPTAVAQQPCSSSRPPEAATTKTPRSNRVGGRTWQKEQYKTLVVNWNPPRPMPLHQSVPVTVDDVWLTVAPKQQSNPLKKYNTTTDTTGLVHEHHEVISVQPRARCMPELNLYLLPYAVPF